MKIISSNFQFGKRLAELRRSKGLTQKTLGDKIGVSQRVVAYYEGETNHPPAALLPLIAKSLGVSLDDLFSAKNGKQEEVTNHLLWKKLRKAEDLETEDQKAVLTMIDRLSRKKAS